VTHGARVYHERTAYSPDRHWMEPVDAPLVRTDYLPGLPELEPLPFKRYVTALPRVVLPPAPPVAPFPQPRRGSLTLHQIAAILFSGAGVLARRTRLDGTVAHRRAAGSAGNRAPLELYLCARNVSGLADAVYHYDPPAHALTEIGPAPIGDSSAVVVCGVPWRTCWWYAERGYRHLWWDAGTALAHVLEVARELGCRPRLMLGFADAAVGHLVGAEPPLEWPLAVVSLGDGEPAIAAAGDAVRGALASDPVDFPLITEAHHAGDLADTASVSRWRGAVAGAHPIPPEVSGGDREDAQLGRLVARRRTTRRFDRTAEIPVDRLHRLMAWCPWAAPSDTGHDLVDVDLLVHRVIDIDPGRYSWRRGELVPGRLADHTHQAFALAMEQAAARDAALVVVYSCDLDEVLRRGGDRGYRVAQLGAGLRTGRLQLAAEEMGLGAGALTFRDSLLAGVLGRPAAGLLLAAVGVPAGRGPDVSA